MTSWRQTASIEVQQDLDGLFEQLVAFARQMLEEHGEFHPFGATVSAAGKFSFTAGFAGDGAPSQEVLALMLEAFQGQREGLRAAALCFDVRLSDSDAIRVELEHREGQAIAVEQPYRRKRMRRGVQYADPQAWDLEARVWPSGG